MEALMTAPMAPPAAALTNMMARPTATSLNPNPVPDRQRFAAFVSCSYCCVFIAL
jgi:hypothetical protein